MDTEEVVNIRNNNCAKELKTQKMVISTDDRSGITCTHKLKGDLPKELHLIVQPIIKDEKYLDKA